MSTPSGETGHAADSGIGRSVISDALTSLLLHADWGWTTESAVTGFLAPSMASRFGASTELAPQL